MNDQLPTLLITRPLPEARALLADLGAANAPDHRQIVSPLIRIEPVMADVALRDHGALIFTSVNAVRRAVQLGDGGGMTAYCVGNRTAIAAGEAGFAAVSAAGNAADLIAMILSARPTGVLLHLRGAESRGDIAENLSRQGQMVRSEIVYRQRLLDLNPEALDALSGPRPVILPIYSPNTAKALLNQAALGPSVHVIAISEAVAASLVDARPGRIDIASRPDGAAMVASICAALGGNSG